MRNLYAVSYTAIRRADEQKGAAYGMVNVEAGTGLTLRMAYSEDEAMGMGYRLAKEFLPDSKGWVKHTVIVAQARAEDLTEASLTALDGIVK